MSFIKKAILITLVVFPLNLFAVEAITNPYFNQPNYPTPQTIRDPFSPSSLMFDTVGTQSGRAATGSYGFMRNPGNPELPKMRLHGFIDKDPDNPIALLEVAGARTYLVHEGDEINIDPAVPNSAIRISKITRLSVTVEAGTLGSIRVQR